MKCFIVTIWIFLLVQVAGYSSIINVPVDYSSIQQAIDAASTGDTVLVAPGTYLENIDFTGKTICVKSAMGPEVTVIDGGSPLIPDFGSVVSFKNGEGTGSVLLGFTVTNGSGTRYVGGTDQGGGIYCHLSSPTISNNIIQTNKAFYGGGIYCTGAPVIKNNIIIDNFAYSGGGVHAEWKSSPTISGNTISSNSAQWNGGGVICVGDLSSEITDNLITENTSIYGGGICCWCNSTAKIANNFITENQAAYGGGIVNSNSTPLITCNSIIINSATANGGGLWCDTYQTITNTILWDNSSPSGPEIFGFPPTITVSHSCIKGGWSGPGNINKDPLFLNETKGDYHLTFTSPCKDNGDNAALGLPDKDFESDPRIANGILDMGADEFYKHLYIRGDATPGGDITLNFNDSPNTAPVYLWIGSGVLDPPFNSNKYGYFYLQTPLLAQISLGIIPPPSGVLSISYTLDPSFPIMDIAMQALIGAKLSNLCLMTVK